MSEPFKKTQDKDEQVHLRIKRHLWQDEDENKTLKKVNKRLTILTVLLLVVSLGLTGLLLYFMNRPQMVDPVYINETKYNEALSIMSNEWFFADEIEDVKERLQNQALIGMTTNEEDPHTYYMTPEEGEEFVQSINRNFVGIGVQYIALDDGMHLIERVFKDSPAEKYGVQPGDFIYSVDGTIVKGLSSDNVSELVRGEEGTTVHMEFLRGDEIVPIDIVRGPIVATAFGEVIDGVGLLEIMQFGQTTGMECKGYLEDFINEGVHKLVIDLRGDGGGYLYSLQDVCALFLPNGSVAIVEEDAKGNQETLLTRGNPIWNDPIVIIVDEATASAAEAFTLAMKEQYSNVTVIGTTTYGKGTVQVTFPFSDGSSLKYTTDKWMSKNGVWVNGVGITPDETVELHPAITSLYGEMEEEDSYKVDSVSPFVETAELLLDYLEYDVDRTDGYFSPSAETALKQFQQDKELEVTGILDITTYRSLISAVTLDWNTTKNHDIQFDRAKEILNG